MKNFILFLACFLFFVSCEKEKTSNLNLIKENFKTDNITTNEFVLKNDTVIVGKLGTEIFIPQDLFENYTKGKIKIKLKEFYSKEDMILNRLSTVTDKDELLESSGMLYLNFTEEEKQLIIKKGKNYKVILPEELLENSNIYSNNNDSIFKWNLEANQIKILFPDIIKNYQYRITVDESGDGGFFKETTPDSLKIVQKTDSLKLLDIINDELQKNEAINDLAAKFVDIPSFEVDIFDEVNHTSMTKYQDIENDKKLSKREKENRIKNRKSFFNTLSEINSFSSDKLGWINIDKILNFDVEKQITISNNDKLFNNDYVIFYNYLERKSLINHFLYNFNSPYKYGKLKIVGKIKLVIYTNDNDKIYYDTFYIDKNSKTDFEVKLKETSLSKLKEILVSP